MRFSTLLALLALVGLFYWSQQVLRREQPGDSVLTGMATVIDGDSLRINGQEMRIKGIDAPEYSQICERMGKEVACGREAAAAMRKQMARAPAVCTGYERDRYSRLLVTCRVLGADVGAAMVREGYAVSFGDYLIEEAEARADNRGLWSGKFDMPRDWRASHPGLHNRSPAQQTKP